MNLSELERKVVDAIDDAQVMTDLTDLVAIPSVDGSDAESDVQEWCADRLRHLGLDVDHWPIDIAQLSADPDFPGSEVPRSQAWGCVGTSDADEADVALILNGHVDVVPPGDFDLWPDRDPFTLRTYDDAVWGRGACDMKAGVAAILGAAAAVRDAGVRMRRPFAVHTVIGEEDGGLGTYATLRRGHTGDACLIAEPTAGQIIPANAGALTFRLLVPGLATHGSTRTRGVSAIEKFELVHEALRRLERDRNHDPDPLFAHLDHGWPVSIGIIRAGDWASTVPDALVAEGRFGVMPGESLRDARLALELAVFAACAGDPWLSEHPVRVAWDGGVFASGRLLPGHPLLDDVAGVVADLTGRVPAASGGPYGSDLRLYTGAGVPTLQYGPGDVGHAHAVDEHVRTADIAHCTRAFAVTILRLCAAV